jgi:hypothetical protein
MKGKVLRPEAYERPEFLLGEHGRNLCGWWRDYSSRFKPRFPDIVFHNTLEEIALHWIGMRPFNYAVAFLTAEGKSIEEVEVMIGTTDNPGKILKIHNDIEEVRWPQGVDIETKALVTYDFVWQNLVDGYEKDKFRISEILETRKGNCLGLTTFMACLLQLSGVETRWIEKPGHVLLGVKGENPYDHFHNPSRDGGDLIVETTVRKGGVRRYGANLDTCREEDAYYIGPASPGGFGLGSYYNSLALELPLGSFERLNQLRKAEQFMQHGPKFTFWFNYGQAMAEYGDAIGDPNLIRRGLDFLRVGAVPEEEEQWVKERQPVLEEHLV